MMHRVDVNMKNLFDDNNQQQSLTNTLNQQIREEKMPLLEGTLEHCHSFEEMNYSGMTLANKQAMKRIGLACILVSLFIISEIIDQGIQREK